MPKMDDLSRRERQIMTVIYARGHATADEVVTGLDDPPTQAAVRTFLRMLEEKGLLRHEKRGRAFVYKPVRPHAQVGKSAFRRVLSTFFGGSLERAVAAHLTDPSARLSADEIERLAALIDQARSKAPGPEDDA